jgi:AraC family transcriptional regulator
VIETYAHKEAAIHSLLLQPLVSSASLGWKGLLLETHLVSPCELTQISTVRSIVEFVSGRDVSYGERPDWRGRFRPYAKHPGTISIYSEGMRPALRSFSRTELIMCGLDLAFVKEVAAEIDPKPAEQLREQIGIRDEALGGLIRLLESEAKSGEPSNSLYVDHLAYAFALRLFSLRKKGPNRHHAKSVLPAHRLRRVLDRMRSDLCTNLDLKTLASESGYSRNHFLRMFRASMECTPHHYFLRLRVEKAQSMMKNSSLRMIDIAEACGFGNQAHFSRVFRRIYGVTPRQYRYQFS